MHLLTGELQKTLGLRPIQRWHGLQEFVQGEAGRQMIDQHLHGNPRSPEAGRPGQPVRVDPDDFVQSPKDLRFHSSKIQETEATRKACKGRTPRPAQRAHLTRQLHVVHLQGRHPLTRS